jgi:hypothetical protein
MTVWYSLLLAVPFVTFGQSVTFEAADVHAVHVNLHRFPAPAAIIRLCHAASFAMSYLITLRS